MTYRFCDVSTYSPPPQYVQVSLHGLNKEHPKLSKLIYHIEL